MVAAPVSFDVSVTTPAEAVAETGELPSTLKAAAISDAREVAVLPSAYVTVLPSPFTVTVTVPVSCNSVPVMASAPPVNAAPDGEALNDAPPVKSGEPVADAADNEKLLAAPGVFDIRVSVDPEELAQTGELPSELNAAAKPEAILACVDVCPYCTCLE